MLISTVIWYLSMLRMVYCQCGCGETMEEYNKYGYKRRYLKGHNPPTNYVGRMYNNGYIEIPVKNHPFRNKHGYVLQHRLVMEQYIGRYLMPQERVHHIDHDPRNNKIENLQLIPTNSQHIILHSFGRRKTSGQRCPKCNSDNVTKDGLRHHKTRQGWHCQNCRVKFRTLRVQDRRLEHMHQQH